MALAETMKALQNKFNPSAAGGQNVTLAFDVLDEETGEGKDYYLVIKDGTCDLQEGRPPKPTCRFTMDSGLLEQIVAGCTDLAKEYKRDCVQARGDLAQLVKFGEFFPA
ncbi:SCP2 sterol-binding domain-containing protein [Streptomyces sp. NPDC048193]|uniref:SCP2 sterol-binding domain-containing protein n=1 Tax=unclassified Streptomyces TaxID=2593676 RepID=UPI003426673C